MRGVFSWAVRLLVVAVCVLIAARSIRIARADWLAAHPPFDGIYRALELEPGDAALLLRAALVRSESGDMSLSVDRELFRAAAANPLNADVPMALGLREEFRGHNAEAERYLVRAADLNHTFKPAWTLINFYARTGQPDKEWPYIRQALALDPLAFDPSPVFDLCWSQTGDAKKILGAMPEHGVAPLQYLIYLLRTKRIEAAIEAWPRALAAAGTNVSPTVADALIVFPDSMVAANRMPEAVRAWNELVEKKIVLSGRLDPAAGVSVADPDFDFPLLDRAFGWRVATEPGLFVTKNASSLRFEFDGNEPEASVLLFTLIPLVPGRGYRLVWKSDASRLGSRQDPGFAFRIVQQPGEIVTECPLLKTGEDGACPFTSLPGAGSARLELRYTRALGTTRAEGVLGMTSVRLEFGS